MKTPEESAADEAAAKTKAEAEAKAKADADAAAAAAGGGGAGGAGQTKDAAYWEAEAKKAFGKRDELAKKLKETEPHLAEYNKIIEAQKSQEQKAAEALAKLADLEKANKEYEEGINKYLEAEIADVPEDKRKLIPDLPPTKKLAWVKEAKAAGLFGSPSSAPAGRGPANGGQVTTMKMSAYTRLVGKELIEARDKVARGELQIVD